MGRKSEPGVILADDWTLPGVFINDANIDGMESHVQKTSTNQNTQFI